MNDPVNAILFLTALALCVYVSRRDTRPRR
jgi:hypothetical protein